jgi:hypothetical protein
LFSGYLIIELPLPNATAVLVITPYRTSIFPTGIQQELRIVAAKEAARPINQIGFLLQRDPDVRQPGPDDLHKIGTAAHRAGINKILLPVRDRKDLEDVPERVRSNIKFVLHECVEDVTRAGLGLETASELRSFNL